MPPKNPNQFSDRGWVFWLIVWADFPGPLPPQLLRPIQRD
jgi:hypothetical protein